MSLSPFTAALNQLCDEKGLPREIVVQAVEAALAAAYRKDYGNPHMIVRAELNEDDISKTKMTQIFKVVEDEEFQDENNQISLTDAKKQKKKIKVEDEIIKPLKSEEKFGRIAAQTAKQVIIQRVQEAERKILFDEFKDKENKLINGTIQQIDGRNIIINLGKTNAVMLPNDRIPNEQYQIGQRIKVFVTGVSESNKGPRITVSRNTVELIKELFAMEVPEIATSTVTIDGIAREAGSRTKIAVSAHQEGLDPVGSCVGQRGIRVQSVLAEVNNEKIDIILFNEDQEKYISNALSPAKIEKIKLNKKTKEAKVYVADDQLSLAIGKGGQNVRLASKLTGWSIDIEKSQIKKDKTDDAPIEDQQIENQDDLKVEDDQVEIKK
jgi:N utilization substance protein A